MKAFLETGLRHPEGSTADSYRTPSPDGGPGAAAGSDCCILAGSRRADLKCWAEWLRRAGVTAVVCGCPPDLERIAGPGATVFVSCEPTGSAAWFEAISR